MWSPCSTGWPRTTANGVRNNNNNNNTTDNNNNVVLIVVITPYSVRMHNSLDLIDWHYLRTLNERKLHLAQWRCCYMDVVDWTGNVCRFNYSENRSGIKFYIDYCFIREKRWDDSFKCRNFCRNRKFQYDFLGIIYVYKLFWYVKSKKTIMYAWFNFS